MTEYGRGPGSEPWHPEDPSYGDGGWEGQQAPTGHQPAYGGQPQHQQHYPQQHQQPHYGTWADGQADPYGQQFYGQQYDPQQYDPQQYVPPQGQQQGQQGYHEGGWDGTGTAAHIPYAADPGDPYGQQPAAYGAQQPDFYGTPDAYPPPEPPARRRAEPEPEERPEGRTDWDPDPEQRDDHPFFADGGDGAGGDGRDDRHDHDDDDPERRGGGRRDRGGTGGGAPAKSKKKSRNGCACLVVALVFVGGIGGVGYFGYEFYQNRYAAAPDYTGDGISQTVSVEIPKGAGGADIGRRLKAAGVVKSVDAFVSAFTSNSDADGIQAGAYVLKKEMSAKSAVEMMLDPNSQSNVVVTPGMRNVKVYEAIDNELGLSAGTTRKVAEKEYDSLGLPDWANDNDNIKDPLEGFLYPGNYPAAKGSKPEAILKSMVQRADAAYEKYDLKGKAAKFDLDNPLQLLTVASLVQAEGKTSDDYRKMAEVVYNRLDRANPETYGFLQFDSTFNYLKSESKIDISESEINSNRDPYNTYTNKGLPPGPIDNPGDVAIEAALNPTDDGWYYFVATDGVSKTEFAKTHDEFQRLKDKFNESTGN